MYCERTVLGIYINFRLVPACKNILPDIKEKLNFPWAEQSL
jgi:hypothetical protein